MMPCLPRKWTAMLLFALGLLIPALTPSAPAQVPDRPPLAAALTLIDRRVSVYCNEEFILLLRIELNAVRLSQDMELQALPDASSVVLDAFKEMPTERTLVDGKVIEIRQYICKARAPRPSMQTLAPILRVGVLTGRHHFFTGEEEVQAYELKVTPLTFTVLGLPDKGRPANFSGAVGQFAFDVVATPTNITPGSLVTLTSRISGKGFLDPIIAPSIAAGDHLKVYDPKMTDDSEGGKRIQQTVVPQTREVAAVPAISFSFFDPAASAYRTLTRGPFPLSFDGTTNRTPTLDIFRPAIPATNTPPTSTSLGPSSTVVTRDLSRIQRLLRPTSWLMVAAGATILLIILASARRRLPATRVMRTAGAAALLFSSAILIVSVFFMVQGGLFRPPEARAALATKVHFAPAEAALVTFEIPAGTTVSILESHGDWLKISHSSRRGWVPASALARP